MTIKGLLFDKDGTLFHYTATWGLWCRRVLLDLTDGDENRAKAVGFGVGYMWESDSFVPGSQIVNGAADEITALWHAELPHLSVEHIDAVCLKH
ncbi:MAG: HAD family hydrolase, partial [Pseudomonadota bacterium]